MPLSLALLDIDHFKLFNDRHGHLGGDECLKAVARMLEGELKRPADLAARYGGEDFCVVLPETEHAGALLVAERLRAAIAAAQVRVAPGVVASVTASFGVASEVPSADTDAQAILAGADAAMYCAKGDGRNMVCLPRTPVMPNAVPSPALYLLQ